MIISNKHKFIFFKTRKTAGSSIQVALSQICDPESDIITGSNVKDGKLDESHSAGWNMDKFITTHPHPPIHPVKQFMISKWNDYFKFAFVRNPFDIAVSRYHWNVKGKQGGAETSPSGFRKWVRDVYIATEFYKNDIQSNYICINNINELDWIGKYENLESDYKELCNRLNVSYIELGFQKSGYRDKTHYSKYYDNETIELISNAFRIDLKLFNYTFEYEKDFELIDRKPIITQDVAMCQNVNGPSLIKVPDWISSPLGRYYLYFADHTGDHIKMAYSDSIDGSYKLYNGGTLQLEDTMATGHIASPDVHIKDDKLIMYFHGGSPNGQMTWKAHSIDGISWHAEEECLTPFYHKEFKYQNKTYAICKNKNINSQLFQLIDGKYQLQYELLEGSRHTAIYVSDNELYIFYTLVGEAPESIYVLKLVDWEPVANYLIATPENSWEGYGLPIVKSTYGMAHGFVNQLRDPCIYVEDDDVYLIYSYGGESGIAFGKLKKINI